MRDSNPRLTAQQFSALTTASQNSYVKSTSVKKTNWLMQLYLCIIIRLETTYFRILLSSVLKLPHNGHFTKNIFVSYLH